MPPRPSCDRTHARHDLTTAVLPWLVPRSRPLTLIDCFGLGINGIIGSGIFLLPAGLQRRAGGQAPLAWLTVGLLCTLVALCFAEAAGRTDRSGGPYRYATEAFGPFVGYGIGWITMISSLLGYAAVARGFAEHASWLFGGDSPGVGTRVIGVVALVGGLAVINILGLKPSARTGDGLSVIKVVGLLVFVVVGAHYIRGDLLHAAPAPGPAEHTGIFAAAFAGLFACTGFEYVPVPAGEMQNPQRTVGLAMAVSVVGATLLYVVVQLVVSGTLPGLATSEHPLVDAAQAFAGGGAARAVAVVAMLSSLGFCAGSAMVLPLYVETFAQDRFLPKLFERRTRLGTPFNAIATVSVIVAVLGSTLDFTSLSDVSNVAVVAQYQSTCLAVLVWRRRDPSGTSFRLPLGPTIPLLALAGTVLFLVQVSRLELAFGAALLVAGLGLGLVTRLMRRAPMQ
jgi:APA family basic amino acid/polyamine antiporter